MKSLAEYIDFVKRQIRYHEKNVASNQGNSSQSAFHTDYAQTFRGLLVLLQEHQAGHKTSIPSTLNPGDVFTLTPQELAGLPKELLDQLNLPEIDPQDTMIVDLINEAGGTLTLDKIMIGLYRKTHEVPLKRQLTSRIYRMISRGLIYKVPKKKGVYTTSKPDEMDDSNDDDKEFELT